MVTAAAIAGLATAVAAEPREQTFDSLSIGRHTPVSAFSFELGYEVWDDNAFSELDVISLKLAGHWVTRTGVGGYVVLPMTYIDVATAVSEDSELALGNIEGGALYAKWFGRTAVVFHGGIALPTAQDEGVASLQLFGSFTRLADVPLHVIDSTWLRLGLSPMGRSGKLLWRADVGLDLALDEDAIELSPIIHLNVGGGVDLGAAQLLVELANSFADPEDNNIDDSASTLAFGARFAAGNLQPGVGILLPIDFDGADDYEWALLASLAVRVPR
jgi:hypothetical protein